MWDQIKINIKLNIKRKLFNVLNLHSPWNEVWDQIKINIKINIKRKLFNVLN